MFRYLLRLPDDQQPEPAMLVTAVPNWSVGDVITVGRGDQLRVIARTCAPVASTASANSSILR